MASALSSLDNASATFNVAADGVVTDPVTGNVEPVWEEVTVRLFLKANPLKVVGFPGVDVENVVYEGYVVSGWDPRVVMGATGVLEFAGGRAEGCRVLTVNMPFGGEGLIGSTLASVLGVRVELAVARQTN